MKVILLRDVAKIGRRNHIVEIPDGYAQNKLIPQKLALPATPQNLKKVNALQAGVTAAKGAKETMFLEAVKKLQATSLEIIAEANEQGHLFKAIHEKDIVEAAKGEGVVIDVASVRIKTTIKSVGEHVIDLVHGQHTVACTIRISKK